MKGFISCLLGGTALFAIAQPALANAAADSDARASSEIIVTAQKREQNAQDIGIAVTAVSGEALNAFKGQPIENLSTYAPSVSIKPVGGANRSVLNIRGVSTNASKGYQEGAVALYMDGAYIGNPGFANAMVFDLQRLEVLRGPQGTLFGRNATGGLIQYITAKPTKTLEGFATASAENFGRFQTEGAISGPLTEHIRGRFAFKTDQGGDYIHNATGPDLGGANFYAGRAQLEFDVGDAGKLTLKAQYMRNVHDRTNGSAQELPTKPTALIQGTYIDAKDTYWADYWAAHPSISGNSTASFINGPGADALGRVWDQRPYHVSQPADTYFDRKASTFTATYEHDFGGVMLTSITDYQKYTVHYASGDPQPLDVTNNVHEWSDQFAQELRLSGETGRLQWTVGGYYMDYIRNNDQTIGVSQRLSVLLDALPTMSSWDITFRARTRTIAGFAQAEYKLTDAFKVIGGFRYGSDRSEFTSNHTFHTLLDPDVCPTFKSFCFVDFNPTLNPDLAKRTENNWNGKLELDYKPSDNVMLYVGVNRGTKAGGYNLTLTGPGDPLDRPFNGEVLTSYEGGIKTTWDGGRTTLNLTAFHYDYDGYQARQPRNLQNTIVNANAKINGAELEFTTRPTEGLFVQGFVTYLDAKAPDYKLPGYVTSIKVNGVKVPVYHPEFIKDRVLDNAPKWTVGGFVRQELNVGSDRVGIQIGGKYNSSYFLSVLNEPVAYQAGYFTGDAQIDYKLSSIPVEVAFYVNNFTDKVYKLYTADNVSFGNADVIFNKPRTYGARLTYRFN